MEERFIDADAAAAHLGITRDQIIRLARKGQLPAHALPNGNRKLRRTWRFKISELNRMMEGNS